MNKFIEQIINILKKDKRLFSKEDNKLLKGELISLISKDDEKLLELLASNKEIEKRFFKKIGKLTIFQKENFLQLITMNEFLPDSFTAFEVNIGLSNNKKLISSQEDISLVFPHKDCILEGGQDKEDVKREEIFYNTTLAPDEIDRLKEPKVLTNWKKFDSKGEHSIKDISIKDNLVIKGNNLMALYSLIPKFRNKIKLIYIDPPYNTGSDSFNYNDSFNHSTWLTFMKNRLEIARDLLSDDGLIFVQCDSNEQAYLKVLMDDIFSRENFITTIIVKSKTPSGVGQESYIFDVIENVHCYAKNCNKVESNSYKIFDEIIDEESKTAKNYHFYIENFGNKESEFNLSTGKGQPIKVVKLKNFKYKNNPVKQTTKEWVYNNYEKIFRLSPANGGLMKKITPQLPKEPCYIEYTPSKGKYANRLVKIYFINREMVVMLTESSEKDEKNKLVNKLVNIHNNWTNESLWQGIANEGGVKMKNGKKPEKLLQRIIDITTKKDDIVMDFFAGAGTTGAVAHKMNRQYILIEQMDYIHDLPEARLKNVISGDQTGISKDVGWKGGGSFVYTELLEWNNKYIRDLENAKTKADIKKIKTKIEKEAFYKYQIDTSKFDNKEFDKLTEKEQKEVLIDVLDMNHLYVNLDSINDATFAVSKEDKELNKKFYNQK
jgi:adenine-specific DNA-methyltransferase